MPFDDILDYIEHADDGGTVMAYFTSHRGPGKEDATKETQSHVWYAHGQLTKQGNALVGDLTTVFQNSDEQQLGAAGVNEGMEQRSNVQWHLEIGADGSIGTQMLLKTKPVGGMPVQRTAGQSLAPGLLTTNQGGAAVTISLDKQPEVAIPK